MSNFPVSPLPTQTNVAVVKEEAWVWLEVEDTVQGERVVEQTALTHVLHDDGAATQLLGYSLVLLLSHLGRWQQTMVVVLYGN